ncbi:MAG: UDP-N-acetylglucosamine 2-epimerase (non-hydrolyzing) [Bacteroidales bacterium]|nr:UDP-N-acetylglucosamine 2-epimerase (non-hydrolyzing) [Candidatus Colimorpha pelethequi]
MKIVTIVGARPQFVKAAVVSRSIANHDGIEEIIVHTGQHYDANMSDVFFREMEIPHPHYNLGINQMSHGAMTGRMLEQIEGILIKEKPDYLLVYGDTDSTLAGALAASKLGIPLAHVEAGLRSFNMSMPEEINRILTDRVSNILFCPTNTAVQNLKLEGYDNINASVVRSGDVMYDAALHYAQHAKAPNVALPKDYILCTLHRAENTDNPQLLGTIFKALEEISHNIMPIVIPLHPRTKAKLQAIKFNFEQSPILFINPVGYFEMIHLIQHSQLIMTDSGGLQKEAYFFEKKCVTLREETEWVELVEVNANKLVGADYSDIIEGVNSMLAHPADFSAKLYGDGHTGDAIVEYLLKH